MTTSRSAEMAWTGMVPVDDTALAVTDSGGPGTPVIYLNGQFATQGYWRRVTAELGSGFRHVTYDERARGRKSKKSADYSFDAAVRDVDVVLAARGVECPLVVGWSYGAAVAVHWATRNPEHTAGVVLVDGAYPYDWSQDAPPERIRQLFRKMSWYLPLLRPTGIVPRMTAEQMADSNIELNDIYGELGPVLDSVTFPLRYIVATGGNLGGEADEMERMRASLPPVLERNHQIKVSAKVSSNHSKVLSKDYKAVADAVRELAALRAN